MDVSFKFIAQFIPVLIYICFAADLSKAKIEENNRTISFNKKKEKKPTNERNKI